MIEDDDDDLDTETPVARARRLHGDAVADLLLQRAYFASPRERARIDRQLAQHGLRVDDDGDLVRRGAR